MASVQFNPEQLAAVQAMLADIKNGAEDAQRRALNRTADHSLVEAARWVGGPYGVLALPISTVKGHMSASYAARAALTSKLTVKGSHIPLSVFDYIFSGTAFPNTMRWVAVKVRNMRPREVWKHVFVARVYGEHATLVQRPGHWGIFQRRFWGPGSSAKGYRGKFLTHPQLPIDELFGPSVPAVLGESPGIMDNVVKEAADYLAGELDHEAQYILDKHK